MTWEIFIDGKFVGSELIEIRQELNAFETAKFAISNDIDNRLLVADDQTVVIKYLGTEVWTGTLQGIKYEQKRLVCTAYDTVYDLLSKKVIDNDFTTDTISTILTAVAAEVPGVSASTAAGGSHTVTFNQTICYDAVKFLARLANLDYYSSGGDTINIAARGQARGVIPIESVSRRGINRNEKRDLILVRGQDSTGAKLTGTAGAGTDVTVFTEKKAQTQASLDALATDYLGQLNKDSSGVVLTINMVYAYPLQPGDTITVVNPSLNLDGSYKIWRISKKSVIAIVEVDVPESLLERLLEKTRNLEDLGIITYGVTDLADISGDLDDIADGTTYKKISGSDVTSNRVDYDKILDGSTYGKIKVDDITSNRVDYDKIGDGVSFIKVSASDLTSNRVDFDKLQDGTTYKKVSGSDLTSNRVDYDKIQDGSTYEKVRGSMVTGGYVKIRAVAGTPSASSYSGQHIYWTAVDKVYFSDGSNWYDTGVTGSDIWSEATRKLTSIYGNTAIDDITNLADGAAEVPAQGLFLVMVWHEQSSGFQIQAKDYNGTWRDLIDFGNNLFDGGGNLYHYVCNSPLYCDGTNIRI
jgi:hypothetical protein